MERAAQGMVPPAAALQLHPGFYRVWEARIPLSATSAYTVLEYRVHKILFPENPDLVTKYF